MSVNRLEQLLQPDAADLTKRQLQAMRDLERAKKRVRATHGKPAWAQKVADEELLTALAFVEEFDALEIEL